MENTSHSFELVSHPDRTLREHLDAVNDISAAALAWKFVSGEAFWPKSELETFRQAAVWFHDFGKGTDYFQRKIIEAIRAGGETEFSRRMAAYILYFEKNKEETALREWEANPKLSNHARLGAYFQFAAFSYSDQIVGLILLKVIRRHHGYLTNFFESRDGGSQVLLAETDLEEIRQQVARMNLELYEKVLSDTGIVLHRSKWAEIEAFFSRERKCIAPARVQLKAAKTLRYFFLQHFLFSLLLAADKGDMMLEKTGDRWAKLKPNRLFAPEMVDEFKQKNLRSKFPEIDAMREKAYQAIAANAQRFSEENFFSITLPTGLGKTFSACNAAILLQNEFARQSGDTSMPRIVYCLPFTSIIDQNAQVIRDIVRTFEGEKFEETLVATHHYLSEYHDKYDGTELTDSERDNLTEGWEHEWVVTTYVQFLESIFTNQNRSLRKFHNMTNAIIVLDEVQSIPPKYHVAIEAVLRGMASFFNTKFVFVTATQPLLFPNRSDILELTDPSRVQTEQFFRNMNRITLDQSFLKETDYTPRDLEDWIQIFQADIDAHPTKSFLLIFNTIGQAQAVFQKLKTENGPAPETVFHTRGDGSKDVQVLYLSGSVLPRRRRQLIALIKRNIKYRRRQIIVSTQVVEAGVDIDLDVVYRDFAPLDSINQSAGRCNRNMREGFQGMVRLFRTGKDSKIYDSTLCKKTENLLRQFPGKIPEADFYDLNERYFAEVRTAVSENADVSLALIKAMQELDLEVVEEKFKLIDERNYYHDVFIPYHPIARRVWAEYKQICRIKERFARKQVLKRLKPRLLQFVTRFPKAKFDVSAEAPGQEDAPILDVPNWKKWYDLESGFRLDVKDETSIFT